MKPTDADYPRPSSTAATKVMKGNRGRDTTPEVALRSALHARGLRFRKHVRPVVDLPCRPDVVFGPARVVVFVDGCFWHRCPEHGTSPRANSYYWRTKLDRNVARDRRVDERLSLEGWTVVRVWEHEDPREAADRIAGVVTQRRRPAIAGAAAARQHHRS